jgi:hypothetical protein
MTGSTDNIHYNEKDDTFFVGIIPNTYQYLLLVEKIKKIKEFPEDD